MRAWRDLPRLREPDRFDAWLHRLTVNACMDLARRRRRRVIEVELTPFDDRSVADSAALVADRDLLDHAMRRLDPDARAVVVLRFYLGLSLEEVADALGISLPAAKSRLYRALAAMRTSIEIADDSTAPVAQEAFA